MGSLAPVSTDESAPAATYATYATKVRKADRVMRRDVMGGFVELYDDSRYLEVGVCRGVTFHRVPAASKVAVDPYFQFDVQERVAADPSATYHEVTSDEYFATIVDPDDRFDVIYLDGLHTHEQTLRDLMNALHHLQPSGVIVIDDTRPPTYLSSLPDRKSFDTVRASLDLVSQKAWMGDVYRLVYFIETFCPHLSFATVSDNHGQTVVWRSRRADVPERSLREVAELSFEDLVLQADHLRLTPYAEILATVRADLGL